MLRNYLQINENFNRIVRIYEMQCQNVERVRIELIDKCRGKFPLSNLDLFTTFLNMYLRFKTFITIRSFKIKQNID